MVAKTFLNNDTEPRKITEVIKGIRGFFFNNLYDGKDKLQA